MQNLFDAKGLTRRSALQIGAAATAIYLLPRNLSARAIRQRVGSDEERYHPMDPSTMQAFALAAVDAAKIAGAHYAEARVTRTVQQTFGQQYRDPIFKSDTEEIALGIRALVDGGWGFASSPYWYLDEAAVLAREAVTQAKVNSAASPSPVDFGKYPVASGTWATPGIDPFQVPIEEKLELIRYIGAYYDDIPRVGQSVRGAGIQSIELYRQERVLATSEGALTMQVLYRSGGALGGESVKGQNRSGASKQFDLCGAGWELFNVSELESKLPALIEQSGTELMSQPVDVGRYDLVCDGRTMANLINATFGSASQLDRALGYEANAAGTSYLGPDPLELLGTLRLGSDELTVTANRSMARGLATVKWDDEGVEPETATLVSKGVLHDYQTTREQAVWLAPYYQKQGMPIRSHGYAGAQSALHITQQCTPNMVMLPGREDTDFAELVSRTKRGVAAIGAEAQVDFQSRGGMVEGIKTFREIVDGKLGNILTDAGCSFTSMEIWKNLIATAGPRSVEPIVCRATKGEPGQETAYTVSAPAGILKDMAIIDVKRKA